MENIKNQILDEERALYALADAAVFSCQFDGPDNGESALKECQNIRVDHCYFNLRYPFWHDHHLTLKNSVLTPNCRAALWYSSQVQIEHTRLHGIKALRECRQVSIKDSDIESAEFGWNCQDVTMQETHVSGEYFMMNSRDLNLDHVVLDGRYSFQYTENVHMKNCVLNTKDAFWHTRNAIISDSIIKGEYLGWYSENLTFKNCAIIGTQPLCYCRNLKLIHCKMLQTDLCFERSDVEATITTPVLSIKNPRSGKIFVPEVGQIIRDFPGMTGEIIQNARN